MRKMLLVVVVLTFAPAIALSEDEASGFKTADLGFLIGTWKVSTAHYDVSDPKAPPRQETGTKICRYALEGDEGPAFIVCENDSTYKGEEEFHEGYIEYINYNPYVGAFEKTNFFSSFPVKVIERVAFDPATRVVEIRGRVEVENDITPTSSYWRFNKDFSAFKPRP